MKRTSSALQVWLFSMALGTSILAAPGNAQTAAPAPDRDDAALNRQQAAAFDQFLDNHPDLAQELRKDPTLVNNQEFLESHSDLQHYLQQHPEVREELSQNPNAIMNQEQRFDRRDDRQQDRRQDQDQRPDQDQRQDRDTDGNRDLDRGRDMDRDRDRDRDRDNDRGRGESDVTRGELRNMDAFMDSHPEIAEQLKKDPSLVNNKKFVADHPALQQFLADHPGVREEIKENPSAFMYREQRYDRREDRQYDRRNDITRGELRNMDAFMDSHPEIAEQLKKDPSLVNDKRFVAGHPALQQFLAEHPGVREEIKENPSAFMYREQRFDQRQDRQYGRDRDVTSGELSSFHEFLEGHAAISSELSKNPSLATNKDYIADHPELRSYLSSHPKVSQELGENPQSFLKSSQQFESTTKPMPKPITEPKMK